MFECLPAEALCWVLGVQGKQTQLTGLVKLTVGAKITVKFELPLDFTGFLVH
jgi:hypothetical protein